MNNDRNFESTPNIINIAKSNDTEQNNIRPINPNNTNIINNSKENTDDFVRSLPSWDLVPPYETVRRINRI